MTKPVYIYCLVDPLTDRIFWVGKTSQPRERLVGHMTDYCTWTDKGWWMNWLRAFGLRPVMIILEVTDISKVRETEDAWIAFMLANGAPLMNSRDGFGRPLPWSRGDNWYIPQRQAA